MSTKFAVELICLGIDAVVCAILFRSYSGLMRTIEDIMRAPIVSLEDDLSQLISTSPTSPSLPYVVIRGHVQPIGAALASQFSHEKSLQGVLQRVTMIEHGKHFRAGYWARSQEPLHSFVNSVAFGLSAATSSQGQTTSTVVEVTDWSHASRLDMDVTYEHFEQSPMFIAAQVMGWTQDHMLHEGIETTEEMLLQNTLLTGIGEVILEDGQVRLRPPADGRDYFLVKCTYQSLVRDLQDDAGFYLRMLTIFGSIGLLLIGYAFQSYWQRLRNASVTKSNEEVLRKIQEERTGSGNQEDVRTLHESLDEVCCVCLYNPSEVMLNPCRHSCLCADCAAIIIKSNPFCPLCRSKILKLDRL